MKTWKLSTIVITLGLAISIPLALAATAWPASSATDLNIGTTILEPSGSTIYGGQLWIVDDGTWTGAVTDGGYVWSMNLDGSNKVSTHIGGDLEGITSKGSYLYLMYEYPQAVAEFDPATRTLTGNTWDLSLIDCSADTAQCLEGFVYDPINDNFLFGRQLDGYTFVKKLGTGGTVTSVGSFAPLNGYLDLSGMYMQDGTLYQIWDRNSEEPRIALGTYDPTTCAYTEYAHYVLAGDNQEGISLNGTTIYIMEDDGGIYSYTGFPTVATTVTPAPAPAPAPDYSTISSYTLSIRKGTLLVTYASGDTTTINFTIGSRATVAVSTDRTKIYMMIGTTMQTYEDGVLTDTVTFAR
ncbi:MAG: hypothetical protein WCT46_04885 [Candidatus Gracilibacteria bacterium]|jgi:hypothetical protein